MPAWMERSLSATTPPPTGTGSNLSRHLRLPGFPLPPHENAPCDPSSTASLIQVLLAQDPAIGFPTGVAERLKASPHFHRWDLAPYRSLLANPSVRRSNLFRHPISPLGVRISGAGGFEEHVPAGTLYGGLPADAQGTSRGHPGVWVTTPAASSQFISRMRCVSTKPVPGTESLLKLWLPAPLLGGPRSCHLGQGQAPRAGLPSWSGPRG